MIIARNHTGHRIGQSHPRAKLTDAKVARMRADHEKGVGYRRLAKKYECGISTARDICNYQTRWNP